MTELDPVRKLIRERVPNLKEMSLALGRSHSFLHQFLTRGTPVKLPEDVRKLLAEKLRCFVYNGRPERMLKKWP